MFRAPEPNKSKADYAPDQKRESLSVMPQPNVNQPEAMNVDMDISTIEVMAYVNEADPTQKETDNEYPHMPDIESDDLFADDQKQYCLQMEPNFETNPFNAYSFGENQLISTVDVQPDLPLVKEEKMDTVPTINDSVIYEVLDSDEEEAAYSKDSGRDTNSIELDASHVPTMSVLMMAKKWKEFFFSHFS